MVSERHHESIQEHIGADPGDEGGADAAWTSGTRNTARLLGAQLSCAGATLAAQRSLSASMSAATAVGDVAGAGGSSCMQHLLQRMSSVSQAVQHEHARLAHLQAQHGAAGAAADPAATQAALAGPSSSTKQPQHQQLLDAGALQQPASAAAAADPAVHGLHEGPAAASAHQLLTLLGRLQEQCKQLDAASAVAVQLATQDAAAAAAPPSTTDTGLDSSLITASLAAIVAGVHDAGSFTGPKNKQPAAVLDVADAPTPSAAAALAAAAAAAAAPASAAAAAGPAAAAAPACAFVQPRQQLLQRLAARCGYTGRSLSTSGQARSDSPAAATPPAKPAASEPAAPLAAIDAGAVAAALAALQRQQQQQQQQDGAARQLSPLPLTAVDEAVAGAQPLLPSASVDTGSPAALGSSHALLRSISGISALAAAHKAPSRRPSNLRPATQQEQQQQQQQVPGGSSPFAAAIGSAVFQARLDGMVAELASVRRQAAAVVQQAAAQGILPQRVAERVLQQQQAQQAAEQEVTDDSEASGAHDTAAAQALLGLSRKRQRDQGPPGGAAAADDGTTRTSADAAAPDTAADAPQCAAKQRRGNLAGSSSALADMPADAAAAAAGDVGATPAEASQAAASAGADAAGHKTRAGPDSSSSVLASLTLQAVGIMCQTQVLAKRQLQLLLAAQAAAPQPAPADLHLQHQTEVLQQKVLVQQLRRQLLLAHCELDASHAQLQQLQQEHDSLTGLHVQLLSKVTGAVGQLVQLARAASMSLEDRQALTSVAAALLPALAANRAYGGA